MGKYALGLDFGSLSVRAVLISLETNAEIETCSMEYSHGVMNMGIADYALQDANDYIESLNYVLINIIKKAKIDASDIVSVGVDATSCTLVLISNEGTILSSFEKYKNRPHAYTKMWKHHAANRYAEKIEYTLNKIDKNILSCYSNKVSSEWLLPKVMEVLYEDEELFDETGYFMDLADFIVYYLTNNITRNYCAMAYKGFYSKERGYLSKELLRKIDSRLEDIFETKLSGCILDIGEEAGRISLKASKKTGLIEGTVVASGNVDAHVSAVSSGLSKDGDLLMIVGTSTCHLLLSKNSKKISGICGIVKDGIIPGFYGVEAGQSAVGDLFNWYINLIDENIDKKDKFNQLEKKASKLKPGESGLVALDWFNGNRSILMDSNLSGLILGMTLTTKQEEIYRALIEATAFGTKKIIEEIRSQGLEVNNIYVAGGISKKNKLMMQLYADILNAQIKVLKSTQIPARGSAICGFVASRKDTDILKASNEMSSMIDEIYIPQLKYEKVYNEIYEQYLYLYKLFGDKKQRVMKKLYELKKGGL